MAAAVTGVAALGVAWLTGGANAATSPLYAHLNPVVHVCTVIGDAVSPRDGIDYQGVVCIDLRAHPGGPVEADVELICQVGPGQSNYGHEVQCAEAETYGSLSNAVNGQQGGTGHCGHAYGSCSTTRNIWEVGTEPLYNTNTKTCASDVSDNYWAVAFADTYWGITAIELPGSDTWVYLNGSGNDSGNESSGHYQICP
jgi:hypothetical protein